MRRSSHSTSPVRRLLPVGLGMLTALALVLLPVAEAHAQQTASQQPVYVVNKSGGDVHLWFGHSDRPNAWLIAGGNTLWYVDLRAAGRDPSGVWDYADQVRVNAQVRGAPDSSRVTRTFPVRGRAKNMRVTWDGATLSFAADYLDAAGKPIASAPSDAGAAAGSGASAPGAPADASTPTEDALNRLIALAGSGPRAAAVIAAILAIAVAAGIAISRLRGVPEGEEEEPTSEEEQEEEEQAPPILELTYPAGRSPLVFTSGWVFGARCILNPGTKDEVDVSDAVRWSGSGSFEPDTGASSRPAFAGEGANTITLTYSGRGQTVTRVFAVDAVAPDRYAHVGTMSVVPADAHGCLSCPHTAVGPLHEGSPTVRIDGRPAGRVGDSGTHVACCASNTFVVRTGDDRVLIDGRPAAWYRSVVAHCGGDGTFVGLGGDGE